MSQQPSLFSQGTSQVPPTSQPPPRQDPGERRPGAVPAWLQYLELSVRVVVRMYLGLIVFVLPWTHFWSDNRLLLMVPHLSFFVLNGITRGIVSGLGLLNIWIGVQDAIHFKQR
ncbi:MAG: hypothetical protein ACRD3F_09130 [Acidobacteriaceae bacterium]